MCSPGQAPRVPFGSALPASANAREVQSLPRHMLRLTPGSFICLPAVGGGMLRSIEEESFTYVPAPPGGSQG